MPNEKISLERAKKLLNIGLCFDGNCFFRDDFNVYWAEITCCSNTEFENIISKINEIKLEEASFDSFLKKRSEKIISMGYNPEEKLLDGSFRFTMSNSGIICDQKDRKINIKSINSHE